MARNLPSIFGRNLINTALLNEGSDVFSSPFTSFTPSTLGSTFLQELGQLQGAQTGLTIYEDTSNNIVVTAELPGVQANTINVTFSNGVLYISGQEEEEESDPENTYYRKAIRSKTIRVALPAQVDEKHKPTAIYNNGIVKVTLAKAKASETTRIPVTTTSAKSGR